MQWLGLMRKVTAVILRRGEMPAKERQFFTIDQAIDAIRIDFEQYPCQVNLFSTLWPMVFGDDAYVIRDPNRQTVWAKTPFAKKPYQVQADELGQQIIRHLKQDPVSPEHIARICTRVFQTVVVADRGPEKDASFGIWINTDMEGFVCTQCGRCCRMLNYHDGCSVADYQRWQDLGRTDILDWVGTIRQKGQVTACRIWMLPGTNRLAETCPWLKKSPDRDRYVCTIHDVRPTICRQYPGSRKHARMTGCGGV
jgi:hypothetical protein